MKAGFRDEAALAAGPKGKVDLGLIGAGFHRKPREWGMGSCAVAGVLDNAPDIPTAFFGEVGHH